MRKLATEKKDQLLKHSIERTANEWAEVLGTTRQHINWCCRFNGVKTKKYSPVRKEKTEQWDTQTFFNADLYFKNGTII